MFQLDQQFTLVNAQVLGNKYRSHLLEIIDPRSEFITVLVATQYNPLLLSCLEAETKTSVIFFTQ